MSDVTLFQPTLPAEGDFSDAEISFMEDSPPGLFPDNQNSNLGFVVRKLFTDKIQELIEQQMTIYNERFVSTSSKYVDEWETQVGLPASIAARSLSQRRQDVTSRITRGPFTRARRAAIVEKYIIATFGIAVQITPEGIPLVSTGTPLYADASGDVTQYYSIVESVSTFYYYVYIDSGITPDIAGLTRELLRITPAGYQFEIASVVDASALYPDPELYPDPDLYPSD